MSNCLGCNKEYTQDPKLDIMDRIHCQACNDKFDQEMIDRLDPNKMHVVAGKRTQPKRKGKYELVTKRKKHVFKQEYTLNY